MRSPNYRKLASYVSWAKMKLRCTNPKHHCWERYGGRGITYQDSWESYDNFVADMGEPPVGRTLDRLDNDGDYTKENCRWATPQEQSRNRGVRRDSPFGIPGVNLEADGKLLAFGKLPGESRIRLYRGDDFFLACCARKSFDARYSSF